LLARWPHTLLHGDVHGGNMIVSSRDGRTYLIDWGNARLGAAAVDLVNCLQSVEDPAWAAYWERVRALGGDALAGQERTAAFLAAKIVVNLTYLPFALGFLPASRSVQMIDETLACRHALSKS
jgi:aminoglycoside phosphotransferase (APT) family kinase protein